MRRSDRNGPTATETETESYCRLRADRRGQTLQDFVLGVTLFLVTTMFVLAFFPGFLPAFAADADSAERTQADLVAGAMVENLSTAGTGSELNASRVAAVTEKDGPALRERFGLPETADLNVTVETLDGTALVTVEPGPTPLATGSSRANETAASAARVVELDDSANPSGCDPACRLVVRVW